MKIVIAGGTGMIGEKMIAQLIERKDQVTLLTRSTAQTKYSSDQVTTVFWDGKTSGEWVRALDGADAVINLCGESIAGKKWDARQKKVLRSSRLDPTRAIVQAIHAAAVKPKVLVNASAVGYYGCVTEAEVNENFPKGRGFLADLCGDWEALAREAEADGVRVALVRIGIVLGQGKGVIGKMVPVFRFFLGGSLGSGKQWFPWVHVQDVATLILVAAQNPVFVGPFNACAPYPVRMEDFCKEIGEILNRPNWLPVPGFLLKLLLGEMSELLIGGQRTVPRLALKAGFKFRYPFLDKALISILHPWRP